MQDNSFMLISNFFLRMDMKKFIVKVACLFIIVIAIDYSAGVVFPYLVANAKVATTNVIIIFVWKPMRIF